MQGITFVPGKKTRQFPFDEVCVQILVELKKRNWKVPGIKVQCYRDGQISHVIGGNFSIWYCRRGPEDEIPSVQRVEFPTEITIPNKQLSVYHDESGPTLYLYVGKDWRKDRKKFMFGRKVNTKLEGRQRIYLRYEGRCMCEGDESSHHTHPDKRSPLLWVDNDLKREYDPEGDEPTFFSTESVFWDFTQYLRDVVLSKIAHSPLPQ